MIVKRFHQYQHIEQPSLTSNNLAIPKRPQNMVLAIQVLAWDRHTYVVGLNNVMGPNKPSRLHNWIYKGKK